MTEMQLATLFRCRILHASLYVIARGNWIIRTVRQAPNSACICTFSPHFALSSTRPCRIAFSFVFYFRAPNFILYSFINGRFPVQCAFVPLRLNVIATNSEWNIILSILYWHRNHNNVIQYSLENIRESNPLSYLFTF